MKILYGECTLNDQQGRAIATFWRPKEGQCYSKIMNCCHLALHSESTFVILVFCKYHENLRYLKFAMSMSKQLSFGNYSAIYCGILISVHVDAIVQNHKLIVISPISTQSFLQLQVAFSIIPSTHPKIIGKGVALPRGILRELQIEENDKEYTANFNDHKCRSTSLAGGKGCSLALLSTITTDKVGERFNKLTKFTFKNIQFQVSEGFVVLTTAFKKQLETSQEIKTSLQHLISRNFNKSTEELQRASKR